MKTRSSLLPIGLLAGILLALLGWAEWTNWNEIARVRQRLRGVELDSDAAEFQTRLLTLHGSLLVRGFGMANGRTRDAYTADSAELGKWLQTRIALLDLPVDSAESDLLTRLRNQYSEYCATVIRWLEINFNNALPAPTEADPLKSALAPLLYSVEAWKNIHHTSLEADIAGVGQSLRVLHALLLTSFFLLAAVAAFAASLVHRGVIVPLRRELVASHALLARQEKLASLGVLAAGVAHEIRNPLTAIKARLFSQQKRLAAGSPEHNDAQIIGGEIGRLERIVRETLQFAKPETPSLETREAAGLLREVGDLIAPGLESRRIAVAVEPGKTLYVRVDGAQMKQVLINLVQNAAESIVEDGQITLRARDAILPLTPRRTGAVALEVEDTGTGVSPEVQARLFDPFFTTKPSGTGLGLAIAARIAQIHGGSLQFRTNPRKGATFIIVLPVAPEPTS